MAIYIKPGERRSLEFPQSAIVRAQSKIKHHPHDSERLNRLAINTIEQPQGSRNSHKMSGDRISISLHHKQIYWLHKPI